MDITHLYKYKEGRPQYTRRRCCYVHAPHLAVFCLIYNTSVASHTVRVAQADIRGLGCSLILYMNTVHKHSARMRTHHHRDEGGARGGDAGGEAGRTQASQDRTAGQTLRGHDEPGRALPSQALQQAGRRHRHRLRCVTRSRSCKYQTGDVSLTTVKYRVYRTAGFSDGEQVERGAPRRDEVLGERLLLHRRDGRGGGKRRVQHRAHAGRRSHRFTLLNNLQ